MLQQLQLWLLQQRLALLQLLLGLLGLMLMAAVQQYAASSDALRGRRGRGLRGRGLL